MNRKHILAAISTIALAGALFYFYGGGQTPAGQPPLQKLSPQNVAEVKSAFNATKGDVRVLLLLSPT
jgi:hypothetical protein